MRRTRLQLRGPRLQLRHLRARQQRQARVHARDPRAEGPPVAALPVSGGVNLTRPPPRPRAG